MQVLRSWLILWVAVAAGCGGKPQASPPAASNVSPPQQISQLEARADALAPVVLRFRGPGRAQVLARLELEHASLEQSIDWATAFAAASKDKALAVRAVNSALQAATLLHPYWAARGQAADGHRRIAALLNLDGVDAAPERRAPALIAAAALGYQAGVPGGTEQADEALRLYERLDDPTGRAWAWCQRGHLGRTPEECMKYLEPALEMFTRIRDEQGRASSLQALGVMAIRQERFNDALRLLRQAGEIYEGRMDHQGAAQARKSRGDLLLRTGKLAEAQHEFRISVSHSWQAGGTLRLDPALENLAISATRQRQFEYASRLFGAAALAREQAGAPPERHRLDYLEATASTCRALGEHLYVDCWNEGYRMSRAEILELAMKTRN